MWTDINDDYDVEFFMEPGAKSPNYFNGIGEDDMEQEVCALSQIRDETSDRRPEHSHSHTQPAAATQKGLKLFKIRFPFLIQAVQCEYKVSIQCQYGHCASSETPN